MATSVQMFRDNSGEMHDNKLSAEIGDARFAMEETLVAREWKTMQAKEIIGFIVSNRRAIQDLYRLIDKKVKAEINNV
jgi:hypothetical protein